METEVKEKDEKTITATVPDVPMPVHRKLMRYKRKINLERNRDYTIMEAYTEYLIESTKEMPE